MRRRHSRNHGFTLIELSIVLVVIGLIIGGILIGQEMIGQAAVRATLAQVESYNTAANTFVTKFGYLPGDIPAANATQLGFFPTGRQGTAGLGDGNGLIEGYNWSGSDTIDGLMSGEAAWFWEDLSINSNMISGNMNVAGTAAYPWGFLPQSLLPLLMPAAKLGNGNYISVYAYEGSNYFSLEHISNLDKDGAIYSEVDLTVQQAYNIDKKVDDGLPQSGRVTAKYENWTLGSFLPSGAVWASGGGVAGGAPGSSTSGTSTTCYDNGGSASNPMQYSMETANGSNVNCALSFKMQGAAR